MSRLQLFTNCNPKLRDRHFASRAGMDGGQLRNNPQSRLIGCFSAKD